MRFILFSILASFLVVSAATASEEAPDSDDCVKLLSPLTDLKQKYDVNPAIMEKCMMLGFDPPLSSRVNGGESAGTRASGASGITIGNIQAPELPPAVAGGALSVETETVRRAMGSERWEGFPCVLPGGYDICKKEAAEGKPNPVIKPEGDPNDPCPAKTDPYHIYGEKTTLGNSSMALQCGGAIPLTTYEFTLNQNPDSLATTESNSYYIWLYKQAGAGQAYKRVTANPLALPTYLCKTKTDANGLPVHDKNGTVIREKSVQLKAPIAQMITFNANATSIALRLQRNNLGTGTETDEETIEAELEEELLPDMPEKFLHLPIVNGVPTVPEDCAEETEYYKEYGEPASQIVFNAARSPICEGTAEQCKNFPAIAKANAACDIVTILLQNVLGTTNADQQNPATQCATYTQYAIIDRSNLIYPIGAGVAPAPMEGRGGVLLPTVDGADLYVESGSTMRITRTAPPIVFNEGGRLELSDGYSIIIGAPGTLDPGHGTLNLVGGGTLYDSNGTEVEVIEKGNSYQIPNPPLNYTAIPMRSVGLAAGFMIPSQPDPYVQLPVAGY